MYFYTKEEEHWLKDNVSKFINTIGLTKEFNQEFNKSRKAGAVRAKIGLLLPTHKWRHSGGKEKGCGSSVTAKKIGSERWTGGYLYIKIADNPIHKNFTTLDIRQNWVAKHRLVWSRAYGEIPEGHMVLFLDGNRENFNIENLYCTSRKITYTLVRNKWFSDNPELTLTAIKWSELKSELR